MCDQYMRELLRVAVAQMCQTIGYHATQTAPLELLQDALHKFLHEFSRDLRRQVEHYNRTEANLDDTYFTLINLNINVHELLDYINNVEPVPIAVEVPKFPAQKSTNLNFLKPGSMEVLTRPVHIYEHLPPMLPSDSNSVLPPHYLHAMPISRNMSMDVCNDPDKDAAINCGMFPNIDSKVIAKSEQLTGYGNGTSDLPHIYLKAAMCSSHLLDEEGRPTREISSVVMTTGGFISPAIEGKLPDTIVPKFVEKLHGLDAPLPPSPPPAPIPETNPSVELKSPISCSNTKIESNGSAITLPTQSVKLPVNPSKIATVAVPNTTSNNNITSAPQDAMGKKVPPSDIVTPSVSKKAIPHHSSLHAPQAPTLASKLLKKAKKKTTPNVQLPLPGKFTRGDLQKTESGLIPSGVETSEKLQRKNKKMLQKMLKTGVDSTGLSADYCNAVFHRIKMEKFLKKQSKYQKKLLHKQKYNLDLDKPDPFVPLPEINISESKLSLAVTSDTQTVIAGGVQTLKQTLALPKPEPTQVSPTTLSSALIKDNSCDAMCSPVKEAMLPDNGHLPPHVLSTPDKKSAVEVKLSAEPDKNKLNIFKKISKQKAQKSVSPNMNRMTSAQIYSGNDSQVINLPCGTTITPSPTAMNRTNSNDTNSINSESPDKKFNEPINCDLGGTMQSPNNPGGNNLSGVLMQGVLNSQSPLDEANKPKKRGRKPGSKNLPKQSPVPLNNASEGTQLKKAKKPKPSKYMYPFPIINFEAANLMANRLQFGNRAADFIPNMGFRQEPITSNMSPQLKDGRKERKKVKLKSQSPNMAATEQTASKLDLGVPTKEEVNTINKKLMRMDTVLQPLVAFNETTLETDKDSLTGLPAKILQSYKSPTSKKRAASQMSPMPQSQPQNTSLMSTMHPNVFMPTAGLGGFPNLLKLYPFPPGPGLIPPTAPNLLLPRLPPTFPLPMPNFKPLSTAKANNSELPSNEKPTDSIVPQLNAERSYCNVAPFVPESMKLIPPETKSDTKKFERDYVKTPSKPIINDKIMKTPENWGTPDSSSTMSKSLPTTPGSALLNVFDVNKQNEKNLLRSPKSINESPIFIGGTFSQNTSPVKTPSVKSSTASSTLLAADDPIELSDDSVDYPPTGFSTLGSTPFNPKGKFSQTLLQLSKPSTNFSQMDDMFTPINSDHAKLPTAELDLSMKDTRKLKKSNKFPKSGKHFFTTPTTELSPLDLFSTDKSGVGKLAGGADLIPLISTGSAYSSKTIPSNSLTATVAAPFAMTKKDFTSASTLENSLLPVNLEAGGILNNNVELQKRKKEHKKLKKLKEDKIKKKKDKKDKSKNKERFDNLEKLIHRNDKVYKDKSLKEILRSDDEPQLNRDFLKKLKKEKKKKYKQIFADVTEPVEIPAINDSPCGSSIEKPAPILAFGSAANMSSAPSVTSSTASFVPKLTLKLGSGQSPTPADDAIQKHASSANLITSNERNKKREPSPELARISPLVTRPPKQKFSVSETMTTTSINSTVMASGGCNNFNILDSFNENNRNTLLPSNNPNVHSLVPPPSPWSSGGTISASSVLLPQQLLQTTKSQDLIGMSSKTDGGVLSATNATAVRPLSTAERQSPVPLISETSRPSSYIDAEGNRVWICPACGKVDDGSPMIGCDGCDAWYHWVCVGISVAPKDNEDWFCRVCITRKKGIHATDKKRRRNKKK